MYRRTSVLPEKPSPQDAVRVRMLGVSDRALSFGAVAEAYERFRPPYPVELLDTVLAYAAQPVRTALEIGAGTGKATRLFAGRGIAVTATEPDAAMLAELRVHVPADVGTVRAAFEDLPLDRRYGLVYVAAALHWTNPEGRWSRMATLLEPGGVFASFAGPFQLVDPAVDGAVRAARAPFLDSDDIPSPDGTPLDADMLWPGTELQRSEWFTDVRQSVVRRRPSRPTWSCRPGGRNRCTAGSARFCRRRSRSMPTSSSTWHVDAASGSPFSPTASVPEMARLVS
jgi:SAM-dependent methyltransferase